MVSRGSLLAAARGAGFSSAHWAALLADALAAARAGAAPGPDQVPVQLLKSSGPAVLRPLVQIVEKSLELMQDAYGNYVVQYVLDVCSDGDVHYVCESLVGKVSLLSIQKFSSNVKEKCFERCSDRVRESYIGN